MINVNKLLMSAVIMTAVVIKAEEAPKSEVVAQESEIYTELKKLFKSVTSQENIDTAKQYTNNGLEQTEKLFTQYPMYIPAAFFLGRASMASKAVNTENLPKDVSKALKRVKSRNMYVGLGLLAGHFYYNRNESAQTDK
jgi:uncharacterized protein involved in propanediol utilization